MRRSRWDYGAEKVRARTLAKFHSPIALDFAGRANDPAIARISVEYRGGRHSDATTREIFGFASKYRYRSKNSSYPAACAAYVTYDDKSQRATRVLCPIEIRGFSKRDIHPNVLAHN